jgi:NAD(P)-dependent dehydrogenase (short-subunit alcohol dehydrogenase family)
MAGKTCMVTGASSGIGKETAKQLAILGADVVMVCRSRERGERARTEIEEGSHTNLELLLSDFRSLDSVRFLAGEFIERHRALHVLVNNAGVARVRRSVTADGFEETFEVNYLSHFLLTNLLLHSLKEGAPSRIVNVSSIGHFGGHINFQDLQMEKGYGVMKAYKQTKLAQVLFTYELSRRLEGTGVTANCLHPGAVATKIWGSLLGRLSRLVLISAAEGAETPVYLASSPEVEGVTGKYFERKEAETSSAESYDLDLAQRLWKESEVMSGLRPPLAEEARSLGA